MKLSEKEVEWLNKEILQSVIKPLLGNDSTYLNENTKGLLQVIIYLF